MRLVDVVLASALLGLGLGFLQTGLPGARAECTAAASRLRHDQVRAHRLAAHPRNAAHVLGE